MWFRRWKSSWQNFSLQDDGFRILFCFTEKLLVAPEPGLGHSSWQRRQCYWPCVGDERARSQPDLCPQATSLGGLSDLELHLCDRRQVVPAGEGIITGALHIEFQERS